jgi:hypothetical protein
MRPTRVSINLCHEILAAVAFVTRELSALLDEAVSYPVCIGYT